MAETGSLRLGVLGSGRGSNLVAIAEAIGRGDLPAKITAAISDAEDAAFLQRAERLGIPGQFIHPGKYRTKLDENAEQAYIAALQSAHVDLVVLAGFMRILKGEFLRAFEGRVINIHPSLLPSFPGLEAWKQALDYGVKHTGATVHFVDQGIDSGAIIAQETLPVQDEDTPESLLERIHSAEHRILPDAIAAIASGKVELKGRRTVRRAS
jgi:phosphoribosylglycinamide formyltransferase 1